MENNIKSVLAPSVLSELKEASDLMRDINSAGGALNFKTVCEGVASLINSTRDNIGMQLKDNERETYSAFLIQAIKKASELI